MRGKDETGCRREDTVIIKVSKNTMLSYPEAPIAEPWKRGSGGKTKDPSVNAYLKARLFQQLPPERTREKLDGQVVTKEAESLTKSTLRILPSIPYSRRWRKKGREKKMIKKDHFNLALPPHIHR